LCWFPTGKPLPKRVFWYWQSGRIATNLRKAFAKADVVHAELKKDLLAVSFRRSPLTLETLAFAGSHRGSWLMMVSIRFASLRQFPRPDEETALKKEALTILSPDLTTLRRAHFCRRA